MKKFLILWCILLALTTMGYAKKPRRTPILQLSKIEHVYVDFLSCNPQIHIDQSLDRNSKVEYRYNQLNCSELPNGWVECKNVKFKFQDGIEHVCPKADFVLSIVNYGDQK